MKRAMIPVLLALALPIAAWARGFDITDQRGTISISDSGIASKGPQMTQYNDIEAPPGHSLGSVSFTVGALMSGSIQAGGTFSSAGSSLVVIGRGHYGEPIGVIFNGAFTGSVDWTLVSAQGQSLVYQLSGAIKGVGHKGKKVSGMSVQTIAATREELAKGVAHIQLGSTISDFNAGH